jgi:hypothetical protein
MGKRSKHAPSEVQPSTSGCVGSALAVGNGALCAYIRRIPTFMPCRSRYVPDPGYREVDALEPKLDCSSVPGSNDQELWLLQLPESVSTLACGGPGARLP